MAPSSPRPIPSLPRNVPLPLSAAQERLWFLDRLQPGSAIYNVAAIASRLRGELNERALARALQELIRRHEALRTRFPARGGKPVQEVAPSLGLPWSRIDLAALPKAGKGVEARRAAQALADKPFDLARGPLITAGLLHLAAADHILVVSVHHIVFDGWSQAVFHRDLAILYEAFAAGRPSPLPELPLQPADVAFLERLQLRQTGGAALAPHLAYWRDRLAGMPPLLELPTDFPRPGEQRFRGAWERFSFSTELSAAVRSFCRREKATHFMLLQAAFAALLARLTGRDDIPVGTPVAGRGEPELEGLIGFFVNTLVLRADLSGDPGGRALLGRLRARTIEAFEHQALPFARLVEELAADRHLSHSPLVQVVFALQRTQGREAVLPGIEAEELTLSGSTAKFDLTLMLAEEEGCFSGALEYDTDLFASTTARRLVDSYLRLLTGMVVHPERSLSALPLLSEGERHQLLQEWNDTGRHYPDSETLHGLFLQVARQRPDAVALVDTGRPGEPGERTVTYGTLARQAERLAGDLRTRGVGTEARVGLTTGRCAESILGLLAILMAGGAYIPLDPAEPQQRRDRWAREAGVTLVLEWEELAPAFRSQGRPSCAAPAERGDPLQLAYVLYTSGSTGTPKRVAVPHRAVVRLVSQITYADLGPEEVHLQLAPLAFDASTFEIWGALLHGGRLVLPPPPPPSAEDLAALLARHGITMLWLTAGLFHAMVEAVPEALAGVRQLLSGGDVLSPAHVRELLQRRSALVGSRFINGYGPTEATTFTCCWSTRDGCLLEAAVPLGRPIANTRVLLLDRNGGPVPLGTAGELWIGGDGLARGYAGDPAATADRFRPDPFPPPGEIGGRLYRSGDLARFQKDGRLDFLGRSDAQVKIRGFRVEPAEIEAALAQHPAVRHAAVLAEGSGASKQLVAYLATDAGPLPGLADLRAFLKEHLPDYLVPATFILLDGIPLTSAGKVDRTALAARRGTGRVLATDSGYTAPRTEAERALARVWQQVLGRERIGIHDGFFELGGDSLLAIQMVSRASQAGLSLSVAQVLKHQTIADLAALAAEAPAAEQGWVTGPVPLTPGQCWFFERVLGKVAAPHAFTSTEIYELREPLPFARFANAAARLGFQHDALRLRFCRTEDGAWEQRLLGEEGLTGLYACVDLANLETARREEATVGAVRQLLAQTDLGSPLARFVLFAGGAQPSRLLLALHHLVSDAASWRILREDLETLWRQFAAGEPPRLPPKTLSFQAWAERQHELARSPELRQQMEEWLALAAQGVARLPIDGEAAGPGEMGFAQAALGEAETAALLAPLPAATGIPFSSALLTGISRALCRWMGTPSVLLRQTDHGRSPDLPGIDLSRTVGWITTTAPVLLAPAEGSAAAALASVEAQLRQVPLRGLGYGLLRYLSGDPAIAGRMESLVASPAGTLNFLGRMDLAAPGAGVGRLVELPLRRGSGLAQENPQLRISGWVEGPPARLRLSIAYNQSFY
ncbi:MAG TPA: amino acid adenylation domain-containing protein, partial [Thermoanaerobaculia bacterium]|nr:amino acid adenylation domain-containing protein [Thermoanaerobaculia bacterium]